MSQDNRPFGGITPSHITRREAIKVGGIAALGLAFSKPIIGSIFPKPAFANYHIGEPLDDWPDLTDPLSPADVGGPGTPGDPSDPGVSNHPGSNGNDDDDDDKPQGSSDGEKDVNFITTEVAPVVAFSVLGNNLTRLWYFDNTSKRWSVYNQSTGADGIIRVIPGQVYLMELRRNQIVVLNGKLRTLYATWHYIVW